MIQGWLVGDDRVLGRLEQMRPAILARIETAMKRLLVDLQTHVKQDKLSGQVIRVRHDRLRASINIAGPKSDGKSFWGSVGTNVVYAAIHEYGGRTPPHVIEPKYKKALAFEIGGETIIRRRVHHPGSVMPERSFLRSALRDMAPQIKTEIEAALAEGMKNA
jgi:phage gpG-like protein